MTLRDLFKQIIAFEHHTNDTDLYMNIWLCHDYQLHETDYSYSKVGDDGIHYGIDEIDEADVLELHTYSFDLNLPVTQVSATEYSFISGNTKFKVSAKIETSKDFVFKNYDKTT